MSNLRHIKTFVFDPAVVALEVTNTKKPHELTLGQVGIFRADTLVGVGVHGSLTPVNTPAIVIHQNVGDSRHGTVRTRTIHANKVRRFYKVNASNPVAQVIAIGYHATANPNATIAVKKGDIADLVVQVYNEELARIYGGPHIRRLPIDLLKCQECITDCNLLDADAVADEIVRLINDPAPALGFPGTSELKNFMTAAKVFTGTGETRKVGVTITVKIPEQPKLNVYNPKQFSKTLSTYVTVGFSDTCADIPVVEVTQGHPGNGFPLQIADLERESQGYDRVRDQFQYDEYMKLANFIINAKDDKKYDTIFLEFDAESMTPAGGQTPYRTYPHLVAIAVPTTTGTSVLNILNAWLTPLGHPSVS